MRRCLLHAALWAMALGFTWLEVSNPRLVAEPLAGSAESTVLMIPRYLLRYIALMVFVMTATCFGIWSTGYWLGPNSSLQRFESTLLVVSIMHFWYDGFIWSIRRKEFS